MPSSTCEIPISKIVSQCTMTIKIKGMKRWRIRLWLGAQIFKIAAFIVSRLVGTKLKIEEE